MKLNYKLYPFQNPNRKSLGDIIILHGLFGSSKNWVTVARFLSNFGSVYAVDQRNHGDSPHTNEHSIQLMSEDLEEFIFDHQIKNPILLGHSMGGLVAMYFDLTHPGIIQKLIIQDIAPRSYPFAYDKEILSMSFPLEGFTSRTEVDSEMAKYVPDTFIRQFLQMSLDRKEDGKYRWKLNVEGLNHARRVFDDVFTFDKTSQTQTLFLLGGDSPYIRDSDLEVMDRFFKNNQKIKIEGGGHYIHFTHQAKYLDILDQELSLIL
ncbi:alpha/beta fold hydrolase [Leptospira sp. 2 VSF19]|uniref:Alpha/beta fold hydrolase n=1 Tax=Leptospira soteropolitanensis TaxID=2950025 RepID=A0AAW5VL96_9LEPT|nr:alpha/beta fold hydrolase [Leptospira soteropolitanensis]MCW7493310.1 alpha/beta fold hydrolase [Leptospira soteropolitanensis]MCW7501158.1 alpha/beta fold hydrolase [Leptospira soteropolitanensis]MCW7523162.1 alpha/beta fold hydrolase [Leptospira soteropolitanensis]MCW7527023.1 alpha/beta fold hydrolase [Leptospira soteropolitanensis]MCW7530880.1 alpha/beta fold hydrolase [Leptospira soteropolitanensis]